MVEKIITLENISLVDFLGVDNDNIKAVTDSFPKTKIVSRGNEIRIQGSGSEILRVNELFMKKYQVTAIHLMSDISPKGFI